MDKVIIGLSCVLLLGACATQKSKADQSGFSKFYHNTTSKFNGYFNANEILEESIAQLNEQHQDNYNEILEVYPYRAVLNPESVSSQLDEAIKKVSIVATVHDYSDWVDDCYLLIAKAEYLKQDYESAQGSLEFFMDEFDIDGSRVNSKPSRKKSRAKKDNSASKRSKRASNKSSAKRAKEAERERKAYNKALRKKKKKSSKGKETADVPPPPSRRSDNIVASKRSTTPQPRPEEKKESEDKRSPEAAQNPGGIKHRPAHQEAQLWLARTYVERENYPRVEYYLNSLASNPYLQNEVKMELPAANAYYALHRGNYAGAIPHLQQAIEVTHNRQLRARYAYILAQIYEMDEQNSSKAYAAYQHVLGFKPIYELEFNTKMSMARTAYLSGASNLESSVAMLEKMLKDDKNEEYIDKIYYTYAQIDLRRQDIDMAIVHLQMAAQHGGSNVAQQTETNYLLATLYFDKGMYVEAKQAFDATLQTMNKGDERYGRTVLLSENLTAIAEHLTNIQLKDSLLQISKLPEAERRALAKDIAQAKLQQQNTLDPASGTPGKKGGNPMTSRPGQPVARPVLNTASQSTFFAYDQRTVRRGERDFARVWGDRPLADNWRIAALIGNANDIAGDTILVASNKIFTNEELDEVLADVPSAPEEVEATKESIMQSMLDLGALYREKLERTDLSMQILEDLLKRFPGSPVTVDAYYQLYLSYLTVNDQVKADYYRDLIISGYPKSKYTLALTDPDFAERQLQEERKLEIHYEEIYALVQAEEYTQAQELINKGNATYGTRHEFQGRIAILEAMCIGHSDGRKAYVSALRNVVAQYPNTDEETKARDMLLLLGEYQNNRLRLEKGSLSANAGSFRVQPSSVHYLLVMIDNFEEVPTKDAKLAISNFNRKYFKLDRLKISNLVFDPKTGQSVILVRSFKSAEEAKKYLSSVQKKSSEFLPEPAIFEAFPVSQFNYREVIKQRSLDNYKQFYEENYQD